MGIKHANAVLKKNSGYVRVRNEIAANRCVACHVPVRIQEIV